MTLDDLKKKTSWEKLAASEQPRQETTLHNGGGKLLFQSIECGGVG